VGGKFQKYAQTRATTTDYYLLASIITAEEGPCGNSQVVYALANVDYRRVLVFAAWLDPHRVLTKKRSGGAIRLDTIEAFERTHGFRAHTVTVEIMQALIALHEQAHLNGTAVEDLECGGASMLNTRLVAEACFPEIMNEPPTILVVFKLHAPRECPACHANMRNTVRKGGRQKSTPAASRSSQ
jgi:hypothetical protein